MQWFQNMKNCRRQLSKLSQVQKIKLNFIFYVRLCMRITLAYSWLFSLLLILINIFQINFLLSIFSFNLTPRPKFLAHLDGQGQKTQKRGMAHVKKKKEEREEQHSIYKKERYRL